MTRILLLISMSVLMVLGLTACPPNNNQSPPPVAPFPGCIPGQPCNQPQPCPVGQIWNGVGCVAQQPCPAGQNCGVYPGGVGGTYYGTLTNVNDDRAKEIGQALYGYCWGFGSYCPDYDNGYIQIQILSPTTSYITMNLGASYYGNPGVNLQGQGQGGPINNNAGTQIQVYFSRWYFNIVSQNQRIDGSTPTVSNVQILYNPDRPFATTTLQRYY